MPDRPYVLLSAAMSADGYLDDSADQRLLLSDAEDFDRVDAVRAGCDAILVGAATVRRDNPSLRVRSAARREDRQRRGQPPSPVRVTLTAGSGLDPAARFFAADGIDRLVYAPAPAAGRERDRLGSVATVIGCGNPLSISDLLADLAGRGIARLMVEGGATVLGEFLTAGLADEFQLAIAPVLVADEAAPRLVPGAGGPARPSWPRYLQLRQVSQTGRMAVLRYQRLAEGQSGAARIISVAATRIGSVRNGADGR